MQIATQSTQTIPLALSPISAGAAIEISEEFQELDINMLVTNGREGFIAYPVTGDSMIDVIPPKSIVFIDTIIAPRNGDIVAAMVNGLVCVKRFECTENRGLYLISSNAKYLPRHITNRDTFSVLGVVRGHLMMH